MFWFEFEDILHLLKIIYVKWDKKGGIDLEKIFLNAMISLLKKNERQFNELSPPLFHLILSTGHVWSVTRL